MQVIATIISPDFLPFAQCLYDAIQKHDPGTELHVLVTGPLTSNENRLHFYQVNELDVSPVKELIKKYEGYNDHLRWSLKPVFLLHLLKKFERIVYLDSDIHVFSSLSFLFDQLKKHSILLTPHYACIDPFQQEEKFRMNFLAGLYNAGFVAVSNEARASLEWWAKACLYRTEIDMANGFYVDQRYLDMIPVIDEKAGIVRHQGCNIGSWNMESFRRIPQADGSVRINDQYAIVFIHFNHETIRHILNGDDGALKPYLMAYEKAFAATGHELNNYIKQYEDWKKTNFFLQVKRSAAIRTHIKKFLFTLAKKL